MTTKLCEFCGKEIPENTKICPYCNKALQDKVLTYTNAKQEKKDTLDVSKYFEEEKNNEKYFDTNIYSFSERAIEKKFERKPVVYEEEYVINKEPLRDEQPVMPLRARRKRKTTNTKSVVLLTAIITIIVLAIITAITLPLLKKDDEVVRDNLESFVETTTESQSTTTTTTAPSETTTTVAHTLSNGSVDIFGYLGVGFSNIESDFGEQIKESESDEFTGGSVYYYDGMSVSTDGNGTIVTIKVDYKTSQNKGKYNFDKIAYFSNYDNVIEALGQPSSDQMADKSEPSITYVTDIGSKQSVKFIFDQNKIVTGIYVFYGD